MLETRYLTSKDAHAVELAARRARAAEMARLLKAGISAVKRAFAGAVAILSAKVVRHV